MVVILSSCNKLSKCNKYIVVYCGKFNQDLVHIIWTVSTSQAYGSVFNCGEEGEGSLKKNICF